MLDTLTLSVEELTEMFARELPCGGVVQLHIPPCGRSATWTLAYGHGCDNTIAPNKCDLCVTLFRDVLDAVLEHRGYLICAHCDLHFYAVEEFVRYRKI